jgi:hypothetical protein
MTPALIWFQMKGLMRSTFTKASVSSRTLLLFRPKKRSKIAEAMAEALT